MGSIGLFELIIVLVIPVIIVVIAYLFGKQAGENKILKQQQKNQQELGK